MEAHGQSGETVPTHKNELEEFATVYFGYPAGHLSTFAADLLEVRGQTAAAERQRVLQNIHRELDEQMQENHQVVQRRQRKDVRREFSLPTQSHKTVTRLLSHASRAESSLSKRHICW